MRFLLRIAAVRERHAPHAFASRTIPLPKLGAIWNTHSPYTVTPIGKRKIFRHLSSPPLSHHASVPCASSCIVPYISRAKCLRRSVHFFPAPPPVVLRYLTNSRRPAPYPYRIPHRDDTPLREDDDRAPSSNDDGVHILCARLHDARGGGARQRDTDRDRAK